MCETVLTVTQAAIMLRRSERTVWRWLRCGRLRSLRCEDVRDLIEVMAVREVRAKPRGRPFRRGYDPRRGQGWRTG